MRGNGLALLGLAVLCGFVLVRAVGFGHVDRLISMDFANVKFNFWFENSGLLLIAINAIWLLQAGPLDPAAPHQTVSAISSRTSVRWPLIAAAAAITGDIRCVRPL
jgi:uncharacterized membrane protein